MNPEKFELGTTKPSIKRARYVFRFSSPFWCNGRSEPEGRHRTRKILSWDFALTSKELFLQIQQYLVEKFDGGFDYTFECVGNVEVMVRFVFFRKLFHRNLFSSAPLWNVRTKVGASV